MACLTRGWVMRPLAARFSIKAWLEAPEERHAMVGGDARQARPVLSLEIVVPMVSLVSKSTGR